MATNQTFRVASEAGGMPMALSPTADLCRVSVSNSFHAGFADRLRGTLRTRERWSLCNIVEISPALFLEGRN